MKSTLILKTIDFVITFVVLIPPNDLVIILITLGTRCKLTNELCFQNINFFF